MTPNAMITSQECLEALALGEELDVPSYPALCQALAQQLLMTRKQLWREIDKTASTCGPSLVPINTI